MSANAKKVTRPKAPIDTTRTWPTRKRAACTQVQSTNWPPFIFAFDETLAVVPESAPGLWSPIWQTSPLFAVLPNFNVRTFPPYGPSVITAIETGNMAIGGILTAPPGDVTSQDSSTLLYVSLLSVQAGKPVPYHGDPIAYVALPIFDEFDEANREAVGTESAIMSWATYFKGVVPPGSPPVHIVLENACDGPFTYRVDSEDVVYLGSGDLHNKEYDDLEQVGALQTLLQNKNQERAYNRFDLNEQGCPY